MLAKYKQMYNNNIITHNISLGVIQWTMWIFTKYTKSSLRAPHATDPIGIMIFITSGLDHFEHHTIIARPLIDRLHLISSFCNHRWVLFYMGIFYLSYQKLLTHTIIFKLSFPNHVQFPSNSRITCRNFLNSTSNRNKFF